ncbi:uncharacterized protein LOC121741440 [Salvia splendens]|uniref:uncharacterized protein LOC121741440 n=1 Tax=Salvia splendens TaxID=180675 RepID=UPI001C258BEE|nr:uncharacterized protein LOC121741440 [Salvia splendens]XP_041990130.1 uncharacterized protein LOC121741440 [Salvia splendens]XP_041990131.1 uncharacterized protein LOC121741440 [Salvia splendens]XP_041990133.1 uncharacterized protein LOC121741440 [Salvia splendens]
MLERSGVGFNDHGDFKISCTDDQRDQIVKQDTHARCMRNKSWPYLEDWKVIFGKDRATGGNSEHVVQATNNSEPEEHVAELEGLSDMNLSFEDVVAGDPAQETCGTEHGGDNAQSQKNSQPSKRSTRKRKGRDDGDGLLELLGKLHAETNSRLETLSKRIGYEMDLGKARQNVFKELGNILALSEDQRYDLCDIIGKDNSRLEIFMGLPEASKSGYVMRIIKKEGLI